MTPFYRKNYFRIIVIPVAYALFLRILFGLHNLSNLFSVMSFTFLFIGPVIMGILSTYFAKTEELKSKTAVFLIPWISLFVFFGTTFLLQLEGWACWMMIFPIFLIASSIGGYIGSKLNKDRKNKVQISIITLLPFLLAPLENKITLTATTYNAYTSIEINAPAEKIWNQVTRVSEIEEHKDTGYLTRFLGFPRPLEAVLNYEGVGAYRKAIFTNGLVFHETVTAYDHLQKMVFSIKANPYEIPSTTLDEHIAVGGKYFDVLNGTYELEKLGETRYKLHLYSNFIMNTKFNFYAGLWAKWIMKDIQNNILKIEKERAESN